MPRDDALGDWLRPLTAARLRSFLAVSACRGDDDSAIAFGAGSVGRFRTMFAASRRKRFRRHVESRRDVPSGRSSRTTAINRLAFDNEFDYFTVIWVEALSLPPRGPASNSALSTRGPGLASVGTRTAAAQKVPQAKPL